MTREKTLAELKALDIGYGYTADGGNTFPFRGQGVGLMPSLDEVLARFPDKRFLINIKSKDANEGAQACGAPCQPATRAACTGLTVYGERRADRRRARGQPAGTCVKAMGRRLADALPRHAIIGARMVAAIVPGRLPRHDGCSCRSTIRVGCSGAGRTAFSARMRDAGNEVGRRRSATRGASFSTGIDTAAEVAQALPQGL